MSLSEIDIFTSAIPQAGEFKKWLKIGDSVQGTYINAREGVDGYGNEQMIYVLKDRDGKIWNIGVKKTVGVVIERMQGAKFGYVVGFRYEEDRPAKQVGAQPAKIVRVYYDSLIVDKDWIAQRQALGETSENNLAINAEADAAPSSVTAPVTATPIQPAIPEV